ncbi:mCG1045242 [Mus musculus]|nr:mCG1045242 [Mus musculus]
MNMFVYLRIRHSDFNHSLYCNFSIYQLKYALCYYMMRMHTEIKIGCYH